MNYSSKYMSLHDFKVTLISVITFYILTRIVFSLFVREKTAYDALVMCDVDLQMRQCSE